MDASVQRALSDKVYDRRKGGALDLERLVRDAVAAGDWDRIAKIVDQLCHDYAYAIHQPYARNGGLIGLAAASIALGSDVARYLDQIVPPVLACFGDQDARVRYYACESMYNIAKTSKGEILPYFNEVFDALSKLAADAEPSVKNGSDLLDRLIKDIVSESAASYVSLVNQDNAMTVTNDAAAAADETQPNATQAFSLGRFIPLLQERIYVMNPFTRMFLVSWITLLDSIPDLELVSYLPSFLGGLFRFMRDSNQDVVTATQRVLERFLEEIKYVAKVKKDIAESRKEEQANDDSASENGSDTGRGKGLAAEISDNEEDNNEEAVVDDEHDEKGSSVGGASGSGSEGDESPANEDWIPGQDVHVDHPKILEILVTYLQESPEEHIQLTALRWIDIFFDICPEDILVFGPQLLNQVLPALSSEASQVRSAAMRVNSSLMDYVLSLPDDDSEDDDARNDQPANTRALSSGNTASKEMNGTESRDSNPHQPRDGTQGTPGAEPSASATSRTVTPDIHQKPANTSFKSHTLDYEGSVASLTFQFLNEHEATRVAALSWLIMLQQKAPRKVLAAHDGTFPALLKTLSDPSDTVVTRDLQLLSQISKKSDDAFFNSFMINLLQLFCTDRRLLETRGNLVIRQLCLNLSPESIYRTMADCLEKDEDIEFNTVMVQNLNNNLITAPELADLRRKLRYWDSKDSQTLFVTLFRAWCHNAVASISLCLLAQAYEQAYNLLQTFADIEMTVQMLIQIDKLVQLLESPVFTFLRLQLLEPATSPYLYKTLYGILMLLPQSAAFAALKNRLNSVSAIGYLHMPQPQQPPQSRPGPTQSGTSGPAFERANRIKSKDESTGSGTVVRWGELLEKFRTVQEKRRRARMPRAPPVGPWDDEPSRMASSQADGAPDKAKAKLLPPSDSGSRRGRATTPADASRAAVGTYSSGAGAAQAHQGAALPGQGPSQPQSPAPQGRDQAQGHRSRFSATNFGRSLAAGVKNKAKK